MPTEPFVEAVDDGADRAGVAHAFMREEPKDAVVVVAGRQATDQVRIGVRGDARQDGDSEARADPRQQAA